MKKTLSMLVSEILRPPTTKEATWAAAWFIPLIYPARSWYPSLLACSDFRVFLSKGSVTSTRCHLCLLLCTSVISGRLLSKCLRVKMAVYHMSFTYLFAINDGGDFLYHLLAYLRPYFMHSSQCILTWVLLWLLFFLLLAMSYQEVGDQLPVLSLSNWAWPFFCS